MTKGITSAIRLDQTSCSKFAHNYITEQNHSFVFNTEVETIEENIAVAFPRKNIYPINNGDCYEMWFILISDDVTGFHGCAFSKDKVL